MRLNVEVYIGTDRLDLFADENIQMNRTVKDFRDLDKVFSDFTQSFTIPASKQTPYISSQLDCLEREQIFNFSNI